ncbi:DUF308 domain-containing protein [Leptothermofonsia sichuanensis E412]|uniref:DUF308 domain-containing protein n=1 Tax=Leptothermofonsia sichuanensis TaxID=2917832 RepID=UPI001CA6DCD3|nr:DUF308 domain-containing protein [Leptothermofonsia sichuanensis]QZZ22191.1 DUF308 domain-containing protein [Leptothermofonsia sichuanensis E412]
MRCTCRLWELGNILGAALTLTLVFGWVILAQGVLEVIAAFKSRSEPGWVWILISGILAIILGILILYQWPIGAAWLLGVFVGINLLFTGVSMILITSGLRRFRLGAEV